MNTQFYKNAQCIPALYEISVSSQNQAVCSDATCSAHALSDPSTCRGRAQEADRLCRWKDVEKGAPRDPTADEGLVVRQTNAGAIVSTSKRRWIKLTAISVPLSDMPSPEPYPPSPISSSQFSPSSGPPSFQVFTRPHVRPPPRIGKSQSTSFTPCWKRSLSRLSRTRTPSSNYFPRPSLTPSQMRSGSRR